MIWNCYRNFNCKDFGRCIDSLRLAAQSLYRISGHPQESTANNNNNNNNNNNKIDRS